MLGFYYFISRNVRYLCLSSYLFHSFSFSACRILLSSTAEEDLRGNAHLSNFPLLLSLCSFLLSSTIPSTQSWGTTMLVINFLIPFISLSPPPLPPPARCHLVLTLRLSPPLSPSRTPFVCFSLISILPLLQTAGRFSIPNPPSYFTIPIHHSIPCSSLQHGSCYTCRQAHLIIKRSQHCQTAFDHRTWRYFHSN